MLPEFKSHFLATSAMQKDYQKEHTQKLVDHAIDPALFDSNCYFVPKINPTSARLAEQGRARLLANRESISNNA